MIRGVRGATTVQENDEKQIIKATAAMLEEMVSKNNIEPEDVVQVLISATPDLTKTFPAKALRLFRDDWTYVPVMCMQELAIESGLSKCIRVMLTARTDLSQKNIHHVYHGQAMKLRPDLKEEHQ
ncbi:chorismate mutase [Terribacillus aidingensis]|uniref:chorismate mutase n=1 Tax=Terribacillus aidingensis TaxID=586416 RepID=A0A285NN26_9BACI|nr:chorismate mutase [Terribacillus aidingensis]SNZ10367.1 chorismate mutase [Terribacillus aidingensis]